MKVIIKTYQKALFQGKCFLFKCFSRLKPLKIYFSCFCLWWQHWEYFSLKYFPKTYAFFGRCAAKGQMAWNLLQMTHRFIETRKCLSNYSWSPIYAGVRMNISGRKWNHTRVIQQFCSKIDDISRSTIESKGKQLKYQKRNSFWEISFECLC